MIIFLHNNNMQINYQLTIFNEGIKKKSLIKLQKRKLSFH